jgi:prepilin-type N-terminal cleavage/methylation domain-containing protein
LHIAADPIASARRARRPSPRGFTLVEVVLAIVVLAISALVAFPTMLSFTQLSDAASDENLATHDLMAAVEDLMATPFANLTTTYAHGTAIPKYTGRSLANEQIVVTYPDPAADPLEIVLTASWTDRRGHPRQEAFRCVRTR